MNIAGLTTVLIAILTTCKGMTTSLIKATVFAVAAPDALFQSAPHFNILFAVPYLRSARILHFGFQNVKGKVKHHLIRQLRENQDLKRDWATFLLDVSFAYQ